MAGDNVDKEMTLPKGSVVKLGQDGAVTVETKGDRKSSKEAEQEKRDKELLSAWASVAGQPEILKHISIYQRLEGTDGFGNNEALVMTLPFSDFMDESGNTKADLEEWLKERVEKGSYVCRLKVNNRVAKNMPFYNYTFISDGKIWKKNKREMNATEEDSDDSGMVAKGRFRGHGFNPSDIARSIESAVKVGLDAKDEDVGEKSNLVKDLTNVIIERDRNKAPDTTMPIILDIVKNAMQPKNDNTTIEAMKMVMESVKDLGRGMESAVKDLGKMIVDTNQKMTEMQIRTIEERSKEKIEAMKMMQDINDKILQHQNKGGNNIEQMNDLIKPLIETFKVVSGVQADAMTSVVNMVKSSLSLAADLKVLSHGEPEEKETIGEKLLSGVLEVGGRVVDGLMAKQQLKENVLPPVQMEDAMDSEGQFVNMIIEDMLKGINSKNSNEVIIDGIITTHSKDMDKIKEMMDKAQEELEPLVTAINKGKIFANFRRMKELIEMLRVKVS